MLEFPIIVDFIKTLQNIDSDDPNSALLNDLTLEGAIILAEKVGFLLEKSIQSNKDRLTSNYKEI